LFAVGAVKKGAGKHQSWSSDGKFIVCDSDLLLPDGTKLEGFINVIDTATREVTPVVPHNTAYTKDQASHAHPCFSPDATKIVFNSTQGGKEMPHMYIALFRKPAGPVNPVLVRGQDGNRIVWARPRSKELAGYVVYRIDSSGKKTAIGEPDAKETSYVDSGRNASGYAVASREFSGGYGRSRDRSAALGA